MIPTIHEKNARTFETLGLGALPSWIDDTIEVVEERNGEFFLEGDLPLGALHVDQIAIDRIILAAPAPGKPAQPFRIADIKKDSVTNTVHVYAPHVSYQLAQTAVRPVDDDEPTQYATAQLAMEALWRYCTPSMTGIFTPYSDIVPSEPKAFGVSEPASVRGALGGIEGSMIDVYGGELEWDRWTVRLLASRGRNTGVIVRYGANLESLDSETDAQSLVTSYIGYAQSGSITIIGDIVHLPGYDSYAYPRVEMIDFSSEFEGTGFLPSTPQITELTMDAVAGKTAALKTSITITAIPEELQNVFLCDTVAVVHPGFDVEQLSKVVRVVYDPVKERYKEVTIGEIQKSITDTIATMMAEQERANKPSGTAAVTSTDEACTGWKGFGVGWDCAQAAMTIQMSRSEFEPDSGSLTWQQATGADYWYTTQLYRPLDMPLEPYNAAASGMSDRLFVTDVFASDFTTTRVKFRLGSPVDPAVYDASDPQFPMARPYIRLKVSGRRATPPRTPRIAAVTGSTSLATIAGTFLAAREGQQRRFKYGANWPYRGSNAVNDADGNALMECDSLALMSLIGMTYNSSPWADTTPNATADFDTVMASWFAGGAVNVPWISDTTELVRQVGGVWINGLGGRIVDQGAMTWWFWDNELVFRPERQDTDGKWVLDLTQLRSGDLVMFRRPQSRFFDHVGHIGVIDRDMDGTVYVIHVTEGAWTNNEVVVRSRLEDEFFAIKPGRYQIGDMYFARIPNGSVEPPTE